jgi:hypothetical protein
MSPYQNGNCIRIRLDRCIQSILQVLLVRTTIITCIQVIIRILDDGNDESVEKSKISVLPRITTWDPFDHLLILDFEGFIVEQSN